MARDFLAQEQEAPKRQGRDFLAQEEPETLGQSLKRAPGRIGTDLFKLGLKAFQSTPEYYEKAKTEVPAFLNPINVVKHPKSRVKNAIAGLAELGHGTLNTPHSATNYLENRLNLLPKGWAVKVPYQEDISGQLDQFTGKEMNPGDALSRGLARNILNISPVAKLASVLNPMKLTAKNITKDVLKTRDRNINELGNEYSNLWKEAENKGFGDALYNVDIDIPTIKKYSPGKGIKGINDFNNNPTLENAHSAKSDLLRIQRDLGKLTTLRTAERQQLHAVNSAIESINKNMFVEKNGKLNGPMAEKYRGIQERYKNEVIPYKNKAINDYLRDELSEDELVNSLSKRAFYRKRGNYHKALKIRKMAKNHPYLAGLGIGSGLGAAGAMTYKELFGDNSLNK
jgi:hypothetical protein